jgi:lambda repressor-like predicted transcriptional regulator
MNANHLSLGKYVNALGDDSGMGKQPSSSLTPAEERARASQSVKEFAENLRRLMDAHEKGMSPESLVKLPGWKAGISSKSIRRYLDREVAPQLDAIELIAKFFDLEPWQILIPGLQPNEKPIRRPLEVLEAVHH